MVKIELSWATRQPVFKSIEERESGAVAQHADRIGDRQSRRDLERLPFP
jgi:hypothetical protein